MSGDDVFALARQVADSVLYEGYVLYPYRASSQKNRTRWQFGVLVPRQWSDGGADEPWFSQTECLVEGDDETVLRVKLRCLQAQAKTVEEAAGGGEFRPVASLDAGDATHVTWDEGIEREIEATLSVADLLGAEQTVPFAIPAGRETEPIATTSGAVAGQISRERWPISGLLRLSADRLDGPYGVVKLRLRVENDTPWAGNGAGRDEAAGERGDDGDDFTRA